MSSESTIITHPVSQFFYYAVLSTIPYYYWRQFTPIIPVDWYLTTVLVLIISVYLIAHKRLPPFDSKNINPWLLLFLLVNFVSSLLSPYQAFAFSEMITLGQIYVFIFLNLIFLTERGLTHILPLVLGLSVGINGFFSSLDYFFGITLFEYGSGVNRSFGIAMGANNVAVMSIFVIPLLFYRMVRASSSVRFAGWFALIVMNLGGLVSCESRAGFLVFLVTLMMMLYANKHLFQPRFLGLAISAVGIGVLLVATAVPDEYFQRQQTLLAEEKDTSLERRARYITVGLRSFFENPVLGTGTFTFPMVWFNSRDALFFKLSYRGAHNTYLDTLVGVGLIGLLVLLGLFFRIFRDFMASIQNFDLIGDPDMKAIATAYFISFLSLVVYGLFKTMLDNKFMILIIAVSQVILLISEQKKEQVYDMV